MFDSISDILKLILQIAQVIALFYAGWKFTRKPHDTLESRITVIEQRIREIDLILGKNEERISEIEEACGVMMRAVLALVEYEIQYCLTEDKQLSKGLEKAKESLDDYFAKKK